MSIKSFLITGYIGGVVAQFVHLNFFHFIFKYDTTAANMGRAFVWSIGNVPVPWWVWVVAFFVGIASSSGDNERTGENTNNSE